MIKRNFKLAVFGLLIGFCFAYSANAQDINQSQVQGSSRGGLISRAPKPAPAIKVSNKQQQQQAQQQGQSLDADLMATGGSNGDQISMNTSQFYALSLMFPQAVDCFTGAQGGGQSADADKGTSGFLGLHWLNKSCWLQKQASAEQDIELNARLRCGDPKYRNAIAYDVPKRDRQRTCISMKVASAKQQMNQFEADMAEIEASSKQRLEELQSCHARIDSANERTERCFDQLTQGK